MQSAGTDGRKKSLPPSLRSVDRLSFAAFKIAEDKGAQTVQRSEIGLAIIRFGKLLYKTLQVGVRCNHKSGNGNFKLFTLGRQVDAPVRHLPVETKTVFIIAFANL